MIEKKITVEDIVRRFSLTVLAGEEHLQNTITQQRVHRPGLEFVGHFDFFPKERVQILGKKEINYLHKLSKEERIIRIGNIVSYHPPCFIVPSGEEGLTYLKHHCIKAGIPLLITKKREVTSEFILKMDAYLVKALAPEMTVHGVCMNVFGIGILIRGNSGVGKSETAHTLIGRGHRLVADDVVVLKKLSSQTILGTHDEKTKEFLALRSLGLLNVVRMYGRTAFQDETRIALDINLTKWHKDDLNNDLEQEPEYVDYMGVKIPSLEIQLQPGRDVAGLIEAAANNWYLRQQGYSAAEEFLSRLEPEFGRIEKR
ncbi:Hpr(Ser) kinase/phosphatase [Schinkia azotoformans MEV2011]|uniref:HPr kinase/phosphorylase n=1 Tax=Schinkia azotoformans MEV2011 TaxID=1348973 RepID=A0A072NLL3_SCHAZ|nr:HPr(Ser) kinase/phosphatase [Schinkia azotoformans]KEF37823.1 Hpr(Ser) kinase/phosphatase [Schinkia azotoformans MEV2011]MEC1693943.1 HPr(Ser) kinase/phosphatase [Schinkia azotoformans]MEC1716113.1 HPr(Ser) kinase/phosphatase [Schinkia azotoformans]MEC1724712.1 HPr(Ser) kinase/phosphatase [Schinkia azotoformans]MEC1740584.1 HPr(Ser) kinase/phosphatase [Schinkia azotoformans]